MHAALIVDQYRLRNEQEWFNRTVVGLASAGAQITRVLPEQEERESRVALTPALHIKPSRLPWTRRSRRDELTKQLESSEPDLIHAMGSSCWTAALEIGRALSVPVALDVWSLADLKAAIRFASVPEVAAIFAVSDGLARELRQHVDPGIVCVMPVGVYMNEVEREILSNPREGAACVLVGRGVDAAEIQSLLEGFEALSRTYPECMLFADLNAEQSHRAWNLAGKLRIRERFSLIPSLNRNRKLAIRADVVLRPGTSGTSTSFLLEAMASPMVPVLVKDDMVSQPVEGGGAFVLHEPEAAEWARTLDAVMQNADASRQVAMQARAWVGRHHRMSDQVTRLFEAYETMVTGGSVRLPTSS